MRRLVFKLVLAGALVGGGYLLGSDRTNVKSNLAGQLSACNEITKAFKESGELNPAIACEEHEGQISLTFPGHADAPRYHLNGSSF